MKPLMSTMFLQYTVGHDACDLPVCCDLAAHEDETKGELN